MALSSSYAIEEDMRTFNQHLQKWTDKQLSGSEGDTNKHAGAMQALNAKAGGLQEEHGVLEATLQGQHKMKENLTSSKNELQSTIGTLQQQLAAMPSSMEEVVGQQASKAQEHGAAELEVMEAEAKLQYKTTELSRAVGLFAERLGMQLTKEEGGVRVAFTNVDARDHQRVFTFVIGIDPSTRSYLVAECVPAVEGVQELLVQVNASNDFGLLVQAMRRNFQALCQ